MVLIFASCGSQPAPAAIQDGNQARNPGNQVEFTPETSLVIRTDLTYSTVQSAVATPKATQDLSFGVTGTVTQIHVGMLDFVSQGQVLAELDPADHLELIAKSEISLQILELRKQLRELDVLNSEYALIDAREALAVARRQGNRDTINRRQLTIQRMELNNEISRLNDSTFDIDYERAYEAHDELVRNIEKTTMVAPSDGYIVFDANLAIGEIAEPRTTMFTFVSTADILLHITSRDAIHFKGQENVSVIIDGDKYRAYSYTPVRGDVIWKANIPSSQAFLAFRFAPRNVHAESTVSAQILIERPNVLAVPRRSIRTVAGGTSVDVLEGDSIVNVPVELGILSGNLVEVISGLSEGDIVIVG